METGSVLLHAPSACFQAPGGGECQLLQTARHLETLGCPVRPMVAWLDRIDSARVLHLFGMSREGLELARIARACGVPVALSPIFWHEPKSVGPLSAGLLQSCRDRAKWWLRTLPIGLPDWRRELVLQADVLLPNSSSEARQLVRFLGAAPDRIRVIPNGVEPRFAFIEPSPARDRVLYVGRIEPRKNLLGLIEALKPTGLPLTVIGGGVPGFEHYAECCRRAGEGVVEWAGPLDHEDRALEAAYARARVLALPSWFETPGLVALEAALAGAAVVITPFGSAREYFGDRVAYASPDRPDEIRRAIQACWVSGPMPELATHVRRHFLWSEVARRTAEVYDALCR